MSKHTALRTLAFMKIRSIRVNSLLLRRKLGIRMTNTDQAVEQKPEADERTQRWAEMLQHAIRARRCISADMRMPTGTSSKSRCASLALRLSPKRRRGHTPSHRAGRAWSQDVSAHHPARNCPQGRCLRPRTRLALSAQFPLRRERYEEAVLCLADRTRSFWA